MSAVGGSCRSVGAGTLEGNGGGGGGIPGAGGGGGDCFSDPGLVDAGGESCLADAGGESCLADAVGGGDEGGGANAIFRAAPSSRRTASSSASNSSIRRRQDKLGWSAGFSSLLRGDDDFLGATAHPSAGGGTDGGKRDVEREAIAGSAATARCRPPPSGTSRSDFISGDTSLRERGGVLGLARPKNRTSMEDTLFTKTHIHFFRLAR